MRFERRKKNSNNQILIIFFLDFMLHIYIYLLYTICFQNMLPKYSIYSLYKTKLCKYTYLYKLLTSILFLLNNV